MALERVARGGRRLLGRGLERAVLARPATCLAWAGRLARPSWRAPSLDELAALLPDVSRERLARARPAISAQELRNEILFVLVRERGMQALDPRVDVRDAGGVDTIRSGGSVVVGWHTGVPLVELPALARLSVPAVFPAPSNPWAPVPGFRFYDIHGEASGRLQFLKHALAHLRKGEGPTLVFLDGAVGDASAEVAFLGRRKRVGRGALSLARMARVPMVPFTSHWSAEARVEVAFHPPLPEPELPRSSRLAWEDAAAATAARFFAGYVREHPERLRVRFMREWLALPRS